MKTIREHWESLPNRKLGEWLMKQEIFDNPNECENEWEALMNVDWALTLHEKELCDCYNLKSWQPLLDALPELRDEPYTYIDPQNEPLGTTVNMPHVSVQPQQDPRRAEVVQLVAAIVMNKAVKWTDTDMSEAVSMAIKFQAEITKQLTNWSKSCTCVESSPGETWCCNLCGLPKDDKQLK